MMLCPLPQRSIFLLTVTNGKMNEELFIFSIAIFFIRIKKSLIFSWKNVHFFLSESRHFEETEVKYLVQTKIIDAKKEIIFFQI